MTKEPKDDLETVRVLVEALEPFEAEERERIIRWAREKLGMSKVEANTSNRFVSSTEGTVAFRPSTSTGVASDIKSFVEAKAPKNDSQFCAVVAFYYRFEAHEEQKKDFIAGEDLQDAARKVNRGRFSKPAQTLINAFGAGYLDKIEHGKYRLNTVGENLVAMVLPGGGSDAKSVRPRGKKRVKKANKRN